MLDLFRRPGDPPDYAWLYGVPAALFAVGLLWAWQTGQDGLVQAGYTVATFLSIGALSGLSSQVRDLGLYYNQTRSCRGPFVS